ncbi:hypothetical protein QAD02_024098 [Eretmocerus hayati]|uniref:Uncharacterized protein n=1 Tax=Eretmocerus hayati TaxID=131215 RepID=A0ACC2PZC8_9HYME|nr:hypothetical protein QAD02_024098 [Eretmocerus hayati]
MFKMANRLRYLRNHAHVFNEDGCDPENTKLFLELTTKCNIPRIIEHGEDLRVCGTGSKYTLSLSQKELIQNIVEDLVHDVCICYERFIFKKTVFTSCFYTRAEIRSNHMILLKNGDMMKLTNLICVRKMISNEQRYVLLGLRMIKSVDGLCRYDEFDSDEIMFITHESAELICCDPEVIETKLVCVPMPDNRYCLVPLVNKVETD